MPMNEIEIRQSEEEGIDLEQAILFTLGDTVFNMREIFGKNTITFNGRGGDITLERPEQDPEDEPLCRLSKIIVFAQDLAFIAKTDYNRIIECLLVFDGWSWNDNIFRAPIWLNDHIEIPVGEARALEGLGCLTGTSLAIRSRLQGELEWYVE